MKFEDIFAMWEIDSTIDKMELADESLKIPKLHSKYYNIYVAEKSILKRYEADMKILKLEKHEFYTQGHTEETRAKGWELPPRGLILKADIPMYMDADNDLIALSLKIGIQQEKVDFLESIIKSFNGRGFLIKSSIEFLKWTSGG